MIETSDVYFFWTEEPLHPGADASTGAIDQPAQRERHTRHLRVQHGGVKGAIKDHCRRHWQAAKGNEAERRLFAIFGPDPAGGSGGVDGAAGGDGAGAVSFSQMRPLLFPVASLRGVFVWITCPLVLGRLAIGLDRIGYPVGQGAEALPLLGGNGPQEGEAWVAPKCPACMPSALVLEESSFQATEKDEVLAAAKWLRQNAMPSSPAYTLWKDRLLSDGTSHLVILSDTDFREFIEHCTDVATRISINPDSGTVKDTGLWTEENIPSDTLLYSVLHVSAPRMGGHDLVKEGQPSAVLVRDAIRAALKEYPLVQVGGNETVGCGITRAVRLAWPEEQPNGK